MTVYVGLLHAVNVGGTGKLLMSDLTALCSELGFTNVRTYIASGNVVFHARGSEPRVKEALVGALTARMGRQAKVALRTAAEMAEVLAKNPFPDAERSRTVAVFLDRPPARDALSDVNAPGGEEVALGKREIYISFGATMGSSKLRVPAAVDGTARNINTIAKLADMAASSGRKRNV